MKKVFKRGDNCPRIDPNVLKTRLGTAVDQYVVHIPRLSGVFSIGIERIFVAWLVGKPCVSQAKIVVITILTKFDTRGVCVNCLPFWTRVR